MHDIMPGYIGDYDDIIIIVVVIIVVVVDNGSSRQSLETAPRTNDATQVVVRKKSQTFDWRRWLHIMKNVVRTLLGDRPSDSRRPRSASIVILS